MPGANRVSAQVCLQGVRVLGIQFGKVCVSNESCIGYTGVMGVLLYPKAIHCCLGSGFHIWLQWDGVVFYDSVIDLMVMRARLFNPV
jgi:hypothetical protein